MKMLVRLKVLLAVCLVCCAPAFAAQKGFSQLIIISGSLSDQGNFSSVHGDVLPPPLFVNHRSTNGPNIDDYFAEILGFPPNKPSLHLIGPVQGNNFAVFQSLAGGHGPEDLPAQIDAYLNSRGGFADPNALHLLLISGTDVINALLNPDDRAATQILNDCVAGMETALRRLARAGAKTIFAPNFTDLSTVPFAIKNGVQARAKRISVEYRVKYEAMLNRVERQLDIDLIRWDFFAFTQQFLPHAAQFGFTNITDSCIDFLASGQCDPDHFLFLADFFPSTRAHRFFAVAMTQAIVEHVARRCRRDNDERFDARCE